MKININDPYGTNYSSVDRWLQKINFPQNVDRYTL